MKIEIDASNGETDVRVTVEDPKAENVVRTVERLSYLVMDLRQKLDFQRDVSDAISRRLARAH